MCDSRFREFHIPEGAHVGLVGRNGAGKTTLFKAILGELPFDDKSISLPKGLKIGAVAQEAPAGRKRSTRWSSRRIPSARA